ncbi:MAG: cytochrome C oxidase subunit II [Actinobacteria bacterium]|uniref:cytochrome-c oxidase n=1 Tax=freshwater metagenome TaxID=449393 RepID=A0A6J6FGV2_9ZZZZ|nr:cytochrome C oxidase subunit II [Actinomycetota bacterium]
MHLKASKRTLITGAVASSALFLSSCSSKDISGLGYEAGVSSVNDSALPLWQGAWITAFIVGGFTLLLILYPVFFNRRKKGDTSFPKQTRYNIPAEVAYTLIPFLIVAVLFYFTAKSESIITKLSPEASVAHTIDVKGIQWSWQFTYQDSPLENATVTGTPENPPTLVIPQGESVRFNLTSNDVVHAFQLHEFMIQMQTLPGVENHLEFIANKLGTYKGFCNILCGRGHTYMRFSVKVVSPADYQTYINSIKAA